MLVIMLTCGVVLVLTGAAFFIYELFTFRDITKRQLNILGEIVAANSTAALAFDNNDDAFQILLALKAEKHVVAACLYDKDGRQFSKYPANLPDKNIPAKPGPDGYQFRNSYLEGFAPVVQGSNRLGTLYIKSDLEAIYSRFRLYSGIVFIFIIVSFIFAYLFSKRLQKNISSPILDLAHAAKRISEYRDYTIRVSKKGDDELGVLTDAFNHMLIEIEKQNLDITAFNVNLENKVKERTSELEGMNATLKQQNAFIETIIDSSIDLIGVFDKELTIVMLNKHADEIYKIKREELIGKYLLDGFPQLKDSDMFRDLNKALNGEIVRNAHYKSPISKRHFENFYIPLRDKNNLVYRVLVIGHDLTEMMEANEKLKLVNNELEKSNRDLEQFAYIASHDLQEPLRKIQIFSELGEKNLQQPEVLQRYLNKINSSAQRMTQLIKAILNYSRLYNAENEFSEIKLNEVVKAIKTDLEILIDEKKAIIETGDLPVIAGVPLQINQLFLNLISNSLKFSEQSPQIYISSRMLTENELPTEFILKNGSYVELIFEDNGIGFDKQYSQKIFSIFQRLHTNQKYAGTGIGLALCKKIVENHNGFITAQSEPGMGTRFCIYFPAIQRADFHSDLISKDLRSV